jgi:hypothetical protein
MVSVQASIADNRPPPTLSRPKFYSRVTNSNYQYTVADQQGISYTFFSVSESCLWTFGRTQFTEIGQFPGLSVNTGEHKQTRKMRIHASSGIRTQDSRVSTV